MKYTKQAMSLAQQIETLKQRGLIIDDEQEAVKRLRFISYFRLAEYWQLMEEPIGSGHSKHTFRPESHFSTALSYYDFDSELKTIIFAAIQRIEIAVRSSVILHFSMQFGPFWFMDEGVFRNARQFAGQLAQLRRELERSTDEFIKEHFLKYEEPDMPPAWKTLEIASMGTLSKMYNNIADNHAKKQVSCDFCIPKPFYFRSWLESLTALRNKCAHHARLWNVHFPVKPMLLRELPNTWISDFTFNPNKLYPQLCCIAYWLNSIDPQNTFTSDIKELLAKFPTVNPAAMGFPQGWRQEPLWL